MPLTSLFEAQMRALALNRSALAQRSGISRPTLRQIMRGGGTITSLAQCLPHLELGWAWSAHPSGDPGADLAALRKLRQLTQAAVAARLQVSRPVIIGIEKRMQGELASLRAYAALLGFRALVAPVRKKRRLIPASNDAARDVVMTPPAFARAICAHFAPHMRDWCEISEGRDFLDRTEPIDWVVTNPPWSRLPEFIVHAMRLADNVVFVAPLPNFTPTWVAAVPA